MENCIFCKIVKNEIPATKLYEDDKIVAFLDIAPVNIGHSLIIPKNHYPNIYETPEDVMADMMRIATKISKALKSFPVDGVNITMNNDSAAGQIIFHSHVHVIPRYADDGLGMWKSRRGYNDGEKEETAKKITEAL